jgi:sialate O-acetylesterase
MLTLLAATAFLPPAQLKLSSLFSDHVVLQQEMRVPIFGEARPGQQIDVEISGQHHHTRADASGRWLVRTNPLKAGGPFEIVVRGGNTVHVRDVMVGEVWLASGQSNMEWRVAWADSPEKDLFDTDPSIRFFTVGRQSSESKANDVHGEWIPSNRQAVFQFSAVAYSFAKQIQKATKVPVGIIHSSWGGTGAESWISRSTLLENPEFAPVVTNYLASIPTYQERRAKFENQLFAYNAEVFKSDPGNDGYHKGWADPDADLGEWQQTIVPGAWETRGLNMDGAVWYRKAIELPESWYGKELRLELGTLDDFDFTYFNGNRIGYTGEGTREPNKLLRSYRVSPGLVRHGSNVIAVRIFDRFGDGGFTGDATDIRLKRVDTGDTLDLSGEWMFRIERQLEPASLATVNDMPTSPVGPGHPQAPGSLWNGMVAPIVPFAIRGVIWYQGESNAPRASQYRRLFPLLINDWRKQWGQGDFPFYFAQLANFRARKSDPSESDWAELREAQLMALKLPRTGMAVTIDIGDPNDIHPKNKREVGRRLALHALAKEYGQQVLRSGPLYRSMRVQGRETQVFFDAVGAKLKTGDGGILRGFAIAGADRKFHWADARISGSSVIVSSPRVSRPVAVRYAWADNPDCNLQDSSGLPASPFRTDDWPGITR